MGWKPYPWRRITPQLAARYRAEGFWADRTLYEYLVDGAARFPTRKIVVDHTAGVSPTFAEAVEEVDRLAAGLLNIGIEKHDYVALIARNSWEWYRARLALDRVGAVAFCLAPSLSTEEVADLLRRVGVRALLTEPRIADSDYAALGQSLRGAAGGIETVVSLGPDDVGVPRASDLVASSTAIEDDATWAARRFTVDEEDTEVCLTAGSTGRPKIFLRTTNGWMTMGGRIMWACRADASDSWLILPPIGQGTGYGLVHGTLRMGGTVHLLAQFDAEKALDLIESERLTMVGSVPAQMIALSEAQRERPRDVGSIRVFMDAGAPLPPANAEQIEGAFGCQIISIYGASDAGAPGFNLSEDTTERRWHTNGRLPPGSDVRLYREDGSVVEAAEEIGQIAMRGPDLIAGFFDDPEATEAGTREGWALTNDLGHFDDDGYLHVTGRRTDMIIRGGTNIDPLEVENALAGWDRVAEVTVVAVDDPRLGQRAGAVVVPRGPAVTVEEMAEELRRRGLSKFKIPEFVCCVEALPRTAAEKIDKAHASAILADSRKVPR